MKILVTGSTGLVGNAIVKNLKKNKFINLLTPSRKELDLESYTKVETYFNINKPEFIFNAAGFVGGISANNKYRTEFIYKNLLLQNNVIYNAHKIGIKYLINFGSSCIYPKNSKTPIKESFLLNGKLEDTNEPYAIAKIAGLKLCESINRDFKKKFLTVMPTNLYGPNDSYDLNNSHVLPALIMKGHKCKAEGKSKFIVWGDGSPKREFLYVDDLAVACFMLMKIINNIKHDIINIGSGKEISIGDLSNKVMNILGFKAKVIYDKSKPNGTKSKLIDSSIINDLGWKPKIDLDKGILLTYSDFLKNHIK